VADNKINYNITKNGLKLGVLNPNNANLKQIHQAREGACGSVNIDLILVRIVGGFLTSHRALYEIRKMGLN